MLLVDFLNKLIKKRGFNLIDATGKVHKIGNENLSEKSLSIKLLDKKLHYKLLYYPDLYFGEAYTDGTIKIENGNLTDVLDIILFNMGRGNLNLANSIIKKIQGTFRYLTSFNLAKKSKENVAHHYDISDDLYELFLDPKRQYSCGYFKNDNDTLETAQNNKINHLIKKLNLKENQTVLDIGSGWGYLGMEIAKQSKCEVTGITLSENQHIFSNKKARRDPYSSREHLSCNSRKSNDGNHTRDFYQTSDGEDSSDFCDNLGWIASTPSH